VLTFKIDPSLTLRAQNDDGILRTELSRREREVEKWTE
jgi:hypothetical protein